MQVIPGIQSLREPLPGSVVTIGNFDGVHRGHQHIISRVVSKARELGVRSVVYTFTPHPFHVVRPEVNLQLLCSSDEKLRLIEAQGVDAVVEEPFTKEFARTPAEVFFTDFLLKRLKAKAIIVGYDFCFGRDRGGNLQSLSSFCSSEGIALEIVDPRELEGEVVSSTLIRKYLLVGDIERANLMLGHEFAYRGIVQPGEARGRKIGFPTANLKIEDKLLLPFGVYATWTTLNPDSGIQNPDEHIPSVTNVGVRPTLGENLPVWVETYLIDQNIHLYGKTIEIRFVSRLRDEMKFASLQALRERIVNDVSLARRRLGIST